jgi:hypothetical protein
MSVLPHVRHSNFCGLGVVFCHKKRVRAATNRFPETSIFSRGGIQYMQSAVEGLLFIGVPFFELFSIKPRLSKIKLLASDLIMNSSSYFLSTSNYQLSLLDPVATILLLNIGNL